MRVRDLPLSRTTIDHFESRGIDELYPPQAAAVEAGVTEGRRLVAAVPTASGKTFVATLAMLTADGPGLYIVPLRALAREKYETFSEVPDVSVGISTGDFDSSAAELGDNDIVVATSEKVDSAIRNGADWISDLACVVVDEVHLVGSEGRGPTLEVTLATLQRRAPGVQIVALSATVANPDELADWLDAGLVQSTWRPVDLRTGVYAGGAVGFDDDTQRQVSVAGDPDDATDATEALVAETVDDGGQALAFVRSRREAETLAERLAGVGSSPEVAEEIRDLDGTETGRRLADCVEGGVAFHHAGLRSAHRIAVERAFRDRRLRAICATPTLAAGVNVPARRVVIRDQKRYTGSGMEWLPTLEVHQMCGRAGRPHLDPYGEAVLVGDPTIRDELWERYVEAEPERVDSKLADPNALRTHVLSIVASDFAASREGVLDVLDATFFAHGTPTDELSGVLDTAIADLVEMEMIVDENGLAATDLGTQVSRQYVTPATGARIVDGLRTAAGMTEVTGLTALEIVCDTPDMQDTYLGNRERADMYRFAQAHADEFTTRMGETDDFEGWLTAVKTARILHEWTEGASAEDLVEQFRIGPGDLESRIERAEWLLGAADAIAGIVDVAADVPFRDRRARL
ncbi:DEAD/DEAH box helicase [Haloplanus aerogenes]|uniref:ATP-dependent DNA helicase Hel308 n=1 Tax=Haloplanus aerogenes TaxID=660522 RepID=A0A3M0DTQ7_9EURY|nr:DEAD/DEAH box helicase [Haloplanus aerogenes]AZH25600.1 DEAD/DEAH box helicase [Haloplanus aerogenes]RMB25322.1 helicase [Haloplanus aerogenes]